MKKNIDGMVSKENTFLIFPIYESDDEKLKKLIPELKVNLKTFELIKKYSLENYKFTGYLSEFTKKYDNSRIIFSKSKILSDYLNRFLKICELLTHKIPPERILIFEKECDEPIVLIYGDIGTIIAPVIDGDD